MQMTNHSFTASSAASVGALHVGTSTEAATSASWQHLIAVGVGVVIDLHPGRHGSTETRIARSCDEPEGEADCPCKSSWVSHKKCMNMLWHSQMTSVLGYDHCHANGHRCTGLQHERCTMAGHSAADANSRKQVNARCCHLTAM